MYPWSQDAAKFFLYYLTAPLDLLLKNGPVLPLFSGEGQGAGLSHRAAKRQVRRRPVLFVSTVWATWVFPITA